MKKIKFKTTKPTCLYPIRTVEVEKETDTHVWINGLELPKISDGDCYFNTFDEATAHLNSQINNRIFILNEQLEMLQDRLNQYEGGRINLSNLTAENLPSDELIGKPETKRYY